MGPSPRAAWAVLALATLAVGAHGLSLVASSDAKPSDPSSMQEDNSLAESDDMGIVPPADYVPMARSGAFMQVKSRLRARLLRSQAAAAARAKLVVHETQSTMSSTSLSANLSLIMGIMMGLGFVAFLMFCGIFVT
mmetsp:Transcript_89869/g.232074  ORF Transcript_89869/g.232074 Transcript_89869/m.232074 type:complete len:136 (-) Transcript_89869:61-468(-)